MTYILVLAIITIVMSLASSLLLSLDKPTKARDDLPLVSILIPLRDEVENVEDLIAKLKSLKYPADKIQILLGEDRSKDQTQANLQKHISGDPRFRIVPIEKDLPGLKAKANVIAQLIPHATSEYYFITDADVRVPDSWIESLLAGKPERYGVVGGTTVVQVDCLWSGLQNIDWIYAQGLLFTASKVFETVAVSGTNMMITRQVCETIGGYGQMPYSLTEDIGILTAAKRAGFPGRNMLTYAAKALTEVQPNFKSLISQRARWTYGVLRLPIPVLILLIIKTFFLTYIIALAWWSPVLAMVLYLAKVIADWIFVRQVGIRIKEKIHFWYFLLFEVYSFLVSLWGLLLYLYPSKINWKGRNY